MFWISFLKIDQNTALFRERLFFWHKRHFFLAEEVFLQAGHIDIRTLKELNIKEQKRNSLH